MDADAIVVGAGAAGLAAARDLAGRSVRVVLLEAGDRIGGRVWSRPLAGITTPVELGAEFIHGRADLTMRLLREAGMAAIDTGGEVWTCLEDGELRREERDFSSVATVFDAARALTHDESVDRFLRRLECNAATRETAVAARGFVEGFDAADPAIASARAIAEEWRSGVDFAIARPAGGYRPIFDHLREACIAAGVQIRLSTIVRRISWRRGEVAVGATCRGEPQTVHARAVILTLPVGVLRHGGDTAVAFDPHLPAAKIEALRHIEMGHVIKVALGFRTAFWERIQGGRYRDAGFFRCERHPFPTYWTQLPVRSMLVVAWVAGPKAVALSGVAEADLIERTLSGFGALFEEPELTRREFEAAITHDWSRDPFARGAYSYVAVGRGDARETLAAPVDDTMFFAGEATSTDGQGGTVNGALETGARAAAEAARSLGAGARRPSDG